MEPGQGKSKDSYTIDDDKIRELYRNVIIGSIHDLGSVNASDVADVRRWVGKSTFENVCYLAKWDPEWVRDVIESIGSLGGNVRREMSRQCVKLLVSVSRIKDKAYEPGMPMSTIGDGSGYESISTQFDGLIKEDSGIEFAKNSSRGVLSRKSKEMHRKKNENRRKSKQ